MARLYEFEIRAILQQVKLRPSEELESESIEFKGYVNANALYNSKELAEELSAFANLGGGTVIIGVRDNSDVQHNQWENQLRGIPDVDILEAKERISGKLRPSVDLLVSNLIFEAKTYVVVQIGKSHESLVSTASGKTCIREGRSSRPMQPSEIERAVKALTRYDWSSDFPDADLNDAIDQQSLAEAMEDFQSKRGLTSPPSQEGYLEAIGATQNGKLTRGGLLFLGNETAIRDALGLFEFRFSWKTPNGELLINDVWSGNLWSAIRRSESYFDECNSTQKFKSGETVFEAPLLDRVAFHEALLNSIVHRDYSVDGMTSVTYSGDEIRIHSPGTFFGGVTAENIARHEPRHRNKNLARILMTHNLVDRAGMGVLRMGLGSLRYGRAFPEFREESNAVEVKLEAKYLRPAIAVLSIEHNQEWGIPELLLLNSVYETGVIGFEVLERSLEKLVDSPLEQIERSVALIPQVEVCGSKDGVFVRVLPAWKMFMAVGRIFRASPSSENYVRLYRYLKTHGEASNADLSDLLGYSYSSQTSKFLRDTKFVERHGNGPSARWCIA
ncbi:MAG: RNA-binding domain-containing protein [Candidatus Thiodiazotropha sp.]